MSAPKNDEEPSKEEILASMKRAMEQALRGEGRPALEVLDEIDQEFEEEASSSSSNGLELSNNK